MAAKDASFNHIAVNADDEDEFVIQAGARPAAAASSQVSDGDADVVVTGGELAEASVPATSRPARGERREQTIEDLDAGPMSLTQKIVIIAVAVFIVAAAVYFFAFMR